MTRADIDSCGRLRTGVEDHQYEIMKTMKQTRRIPALMLMMALTAPAGLTAQTVKAHASPDTMPASRAATKPAAAGKTAARTTGSAANSPQRKQPNEWRVGLDMALSSSSGNENITVLTTGFKVRHLVKKDYELAFAANYRYGRSGAQVAANDLKASVNYELSPQADFSPFLSASAEHDPFRKLNIRAHGGAGAKYHIVHTDDADLQVSLAALYSYQSFDLGPNPAPTLSPFARDGRLSWRVQGEKTLHSGIKLENTTQYQPVWDRGGNYLLNSDTTARMVVSQHMAVTFGYLFERNSAPLPGVRPDDQLLSGGISLQW